VAKLFPLWRGQSAQVLAAVVVEAVIGFLAVFPIVPAEVFVLVLLLAGLQFPQKILDLLLVQFGPQGQQPLQGVGLQAIAGLFCLLVQVRQVLRGNPLAVQQGGGIVEDSDIAGQFIPPMPLQVVCQQLVQKLTLLGVEVHIAAQVPGHQQMQAVVEEAGAAAARQHQGRCH